ncbi:penicillin-binding protein 1B [Moraxella catarrhalis]|uniref:Penicillin-binding protein 1B n=1 Tax=Moraxella catarrhalis TaxID=480 RepID=A0A7Z0UXJ4_MORCA|nr:penicillin-binding protein 1B [Moraxella catarrhalis]OAV00082.1 Multimodular transpeptidase-transglycosylase [Moraxella catarrhalis]
MSKSLPCPNHRQSGFVATGLLLIIILVMIAAFVVYAMYLNAAVVSKFEKRKWDIPATLYSRPLNLHQGANLSASELESWLKLLRYSSGNTNQTGRYQKNGQTYTIYTRGFNYGDTDKNPKQLIEVRFENGTIKSLKSTVPNPHGMVRLEPIKIGSIYPDNNEDRLLITADQMPKPLIDALIATEDRAFYRHYGISVRGITRALIANLSGGQVQQGGSTITQQLIKNFYLNSERTFKRKANEALMALLLELHYNKDEILLAYMNEINLGQNGNQSVNGFGIASQFYFDKPLGELSLDQYALLVGLARGPSHYNPRKNPERALDRRNTVLNNMLVTGKIDEATYQKAIEQPLGVVKSPAIAKPQFPDFFDVVQRELKTHYRQEDLQNRGLRIISTLDPLAQQAANTAMANKLGELRKKGSRTRDLQGALVSAHPATGELVALVGSGSEFTGFNRAIDAKRQVGSLLKPVIYLTAFQSGKYNLTTPVNDNQVTYTVGGRSWTPKNYGGNSHGSVPLLTALANSYNQAAVNVGIELGMNAFKAQMGNLSITADIPPYPSVMLGAIDLSPMQMLGMYQIFANGGAYTPIHTIRTVMDDKGRILQRSQPNHQFRAPPQAVYLLNRGLQEVIKSGTAKAANSINGQLGLAGKTGTTNDNRDAWFAGYSGNYVSVVWVGRDDNKPIGLTGGTGALPIWTDYMKRLNLTAVNLPLPAGVTWQWMDGNSGLPTLQACAGAKWLPVIDLYRPHQMSACAAEVQYQNQRYQQMLEYGSQGIADTGDIYIEDAPIYDEPAEDSDNPW